MAGRMWFGNRAYMQWVPAPAINADFSRVGWGTKTQFLNGGASVRRSYSAHKEYNLSWNLTSRDYLRPITDYAEGIYGDGPIYFLDPMAVDKNLLPQQWATPSMALLDGMPLIRDVTPVAVDYNTVTNGYSNRGVTYTAVGVSEKLWIPIAPGHTLWLGFRGSVTGSGAVLVTPTNGSLTYAPLVLPPTSETDQNRVNIALPVDTYDGVELSLRITGNATDTVTLRGLMAQMVPVGYTPTTGGFVSGQGHSGLQFESQPVTSAYSAALDKVGMNAKLVETTAWQ